MSVRARLTVLDADVAFAADEVEQARGLAETVLTLAGVPPEVCCHALEIVGRAHRFRVKAADPLARPAPAAHPDHQAADRA